jgi:hypothetical protein
VRNTPQLIDQSEEAMPTEESETIEAVRVAAVPISIEIDAMVAALPDGADLSKIAFDLISELEAMCDRRDIITIFYEGLIAREVMIRTGVKF